MDLKELYITAELAKLDITEAQAEELSREVSRMLDYFSMMMEIDVSSLEPTSHVLQKENRTRDDSVFEDTVSEDRLLDNAPQIDGRFIVIPNVL